jgi:hypothetical protein
LAFGFFIVSSLAFWVSSFLLSGAMRSISSLRQAYRAPAPQPRVVVPSSFRATRLGRRR